MVERTKQAKDENTIRRMRFACCITKATDTHSEIVILIVFITAALFARTRFIVTCICILPVVFFPSSLKWRCLFGTLLSIYSVTFAIKPS